MSDELNHYIPKHLDDKSKFLMIDQDVGLLAMLVTVMGVWAGFPLSGFIAGVVVAYQFNKLKGGSHPGYTVHLIHWFTGAPEMKDLPNSNIRELNG